MTTDGPTDRPTARSSDDFEWRGWILVSAIVVSFLALPIAVVFLPAAQTQIRSFGLTLRDAYLVLPLVPALVLGAIAVWSALRTRER